MTPAVRLVPLVLLLAACHARAETHRIDDSASVVESHAVQMQWDHLAPGSGGSQVSGRLTVHARLDVSPWRGRHGRIHLTLPPSAAAPVSARWTTRGRLLPGALRTGERALVYAGPVPAGLLEDTLQLELQADGRDLLRHERLDFVFEIDLEPL